MSTQNHTNSASADMPMKPWLKCLNIGVGLALLGHCLVFPKPRDWNAYPPKDIGKLTQYDKTAASPRTMRVLRWLDAGFYPPPVPADDGSVYIATERTVEEPAAKRGRPKLIAVNNQTGDVRWERALSGYWVSDLELKEGVLSVCTDRREETSGGWYRFRFDAKSGQDRGLERGDLPTTRSQQYLLYKNPYPKGAARVFPGDDPVTGWQWQNNPLPTDTCLASLSDKRDTLYLLRRDSRSKAGFVLESRQMRDGFLKWQFPFPVTDTFEGQLYLSQNHQTLYFVGDNSLLLALDTKNGKKRWKAQTLTPDRLSGEAQVATGPGGIIVVEGNDSRHESGGSSLRAYDENTGRILWQVDPNSSHSESSIYPINPVFGENGIVYALNSGKMTAVDSKTMTAVDSKTGKVLWTVAPPDNYRILTGCAVGPDNTVYFGAKNFGRDMYSGKPAACLIAVQNGAVRGDRRVDQTEPEILTLPGQENR